jgi:peptidoglycan/xylan/chitin deacetylase (PgdA/CDA1 family)
MIQRFVVAVFLLLTIPLHAQEIALTFDDAPRPDTKRFTGEERTRRLIESLKKAGVDDVMFFVTTKHINETSKKRLDAYTTAGFHLGNHSHSHLSANREDMDTYLPDITNADSILKGYENYLPFYRYPFLHQGNTRERRDQVRVHLKELGLSVGYTTVDNYEWYMDTLLQRALKEGNEIDYEVLKKVYIEVLWEAIQFYDGIARETLGRSPKHVLLLHENDLAALFVGDLVAHIRSQGWKIVSPQVAYEDPIASMIPDVLFNGQGRVAAIAKGKGWEPRKLVHDAEDEKYLEALFENRKIIKAH